MKNQHVHFTAKRNVYVASLPPHFTDQKLRDLFTPFGAIVSVKAMCEQRTGQCKGYGFVLFEQEESAATAMNNLIGYSIDGCRIQVRYAHAAATPQEARLANEQQYFSPPPFSQSHPHVFAPPTQPMYYPQMMPQPNIFSYPQLMPQHAPQPMFIQQQQQIPCHPLTDHMCNINSFLPVTPSPSLSSVPPSISFTANSSGTTATSPTHDLPSFVVFLQAPLQHVNPPTPFELSAIRTHPGSPSASFTLVEMYPH